MKLRTVFKMVYVNFKIFWNSVFNGTPVPYKVLIQLTNDCNSRCKSCHIWKINLENPSLKTKELVISDYEKFFSDYGKNIYWVALSGGEISLFDNITEFFQLLAHHCPNLSLLTFTTNGLLPEKIAEIASRAKSILPQTDFFVTVSLDGDEELHDKLRGVPGNYQLAHLTFKNLKELKIPVHFGFTLNNQNAHQSDSVTAKAISIVHSEGIYNKSLTLENAQLGSALSRIKSRYRIESAGEIIEYLYLKIGVKFLKQERSIMPVPCEVIQTSIHLSPNGEVLPCMYMPSLGNIKNQDINSILSSRETAESLERIKKEECPKCWMNCYAPHSMMRHPFKTLKASL